MGVLDSILAAKRQSLSELGQRRLPSPPARRAVSLKRVPGGRINLISEFKRRSPSAGVLSSRLTLEQRVQAYERAGARMLSVLTDTPFFDGKFEDLANARRASSLPILCKDFVIDERQLDAARAHGADAVLLIARCVSEERLAELGAAAIERELVPFVEVVNEAEAQAALGFGAELIGVNARDLDTLTMDLGRAARVLAVIPAERTRVHLSGLSSPAAVAALVAQNVDAALIGEALMRADDPEPLLAAMVSESGAAR